MDTRTGEIYYQDDLKKQLKAGDITQEEFGQYFRKMVRDPTGQERKLRKVGRNSACPCGSGKKFKRCCLWRLPLHKR